MEKHVELSYLLDFYGALLTDHQRSLMEQTVNEDCSLSEIAEREGISRQGVRDALKRGEEQLYTMEKKLLFAARTLSIREELDQLNGSIRRASIPENTRVDLQRQVDSIIETLEGENGI